MCEEAKKLTEEQLKTIHKFIAKYAPRDYSKKDREDWVEGWYDACLAKDEAVEDMLRLAKKYMNAKVTDADAGFIEDTIRYCDS
ncbi:MAG: hypothetical protein LUD47_07745 [Clostridia bacterium]|nr:hypothetical protein [Clostridia bacterium]